MKYLITIFFFSLFISCIGNAQTKEKATYKVVKTKAEWQKALTPMQYYVLREAGTERPFTSKLNKNYSDGTYTCAACNTPLYESAHKFDSGTGWPSFDRAIKNNVELDVDYKIGYARTELKCSTCGSHLGHSFDDGPSKTTGKRHCINGVALKFIPK
ncbi:peptide-methionine (R)-S-oxide reductase MsrB [Tenacibaculum maritimum]|uniref:peptide-methionine (R)-S-oxide reductase n=1 Tax=Tenacibaculum maritimum NCIMB 2154 TaxID=1349785 RepID=A0A2H1EAD5_9FLAO|nr:peptide-methionine (R)-S-oxide reductase MsrB [Tenacibaculum maritimum]MCD9561744.1 peptide-methionine (R)-S-oxide reductase MsrB [Tenacibaculum maritimum]MCD9565180.1 peptide-methionine (R)-S-oxide reductase MsrB [Tenacibaculum maritimum]MCD9578580.1 peptide-methionine (R)-S-oxide reductase MsrB [Tenacibaculum maritimum]MCD9582660.1 peptide-methionine (R)-S-oxide reductase MsrB [Tenacibaculum maritimum]MCD9583563.1 peptide-methionine (R)-S-oxide reductase MsrB [Tenacibaculum maritimum]